MLFPRVVLIVDWVRSISFVKCFVSNQKTKLRELWKLVKKIRREMKKKNFKWTNKKLTISAED